MFISGQLLSLFESTHDRQCPVMDKPAMAHLCRETLCMQRLKRKAGPDGLRPAPAPSPGACRGRTSHPRTDADPAHLACTIHKSP